MDRIFMFIASGAYSGYLPKAPGTGGSMAGVAMWFGLRRLELIPYIGVIAVLFVTGAICAGAAEKILDRGDPGIVVIDEIVGQLIALTALPAHPVTVLAGFLIFRLFDIVKPFPINWLDRHIHGGIGIMLDDVLAGLFTLVIMQIGWRVIGS